MNNKNLLYNIGDKPKKIKEWLLYGLQQVLSIFVATVLIANICGTPVDACLVGACVGTILYQIITKFKSPVFISSSGAMVSAVVGALAIGDGQNYTAVLLGGVVVLIIYSLFSLLVKKLGSGFINKIFPSYIVGPVTMVIGLNLATFIPTYTQVQGSYNLWGIGLAFVTLIIVAVISHYGKGFLKTIPFLLALIGGYIVALILSITKIAPIIDFAAFKNIKIFNMPDFSFMHLNFSTLTWAGVGQVILLFVPVSICAMLEHISDHKCLSNIIGTDLTENPGLSKTLLGDGVASAVGTLVCGLPNTTYGESVACVGFSRVASVWVITTAAIMTGVLGFIYPIQAFINSIPPCVFGGCAMILYGYIACSGLKTILNNKVNLENNKILIVTSAILTCGVSGIFLQIGTLKLASVALSMVIGVIINLLLRDPKMVKND